MKLKKLLSVALASVLALSAFAAIPVSAADAAPTGIDQNLIIHYDFEGENIKEALKDKAPAGESQDDLNVYVNKALFTGDMETGLTVDIANGSAKATVDGTGFGIPVDGTDESGSAVVLSPDAKKINGETTWFIRAKLENVDEWQYHAFVDINKGGGRPFRFLYDKTNKQFVFSVGYEGAVKNNTRVDYEYDYTAAKWLNMAVVFTPTEVEGVASYKVDFYLAEGMPTTVADWGTSKLDNYTIPATRNEVKEYVPIISYSGGNDAKGVIMDDLRLYDKALTLDQIATITTTGSFDTAAKTANVVNIVGNPTAAAENEGGNEENTTAPEENTTAPEKETTAKVDETTAKKDETTAPEVEVTTGGGDDTAEKKGCGAAIGSGAIILAVAATAAFVTKKKKED